MKSTVLKNTLIITTAMLAIFESIIENIKVRDLKHVSTIIYVTRREDDAIELTRKLKSEVRNIGYNSKLFKGTINNTNFYISSSSALRLTPIPFDSSKCKCPNCGFNLSRKKAVVFLDGTVDIETEIRKHFPEAEWDLDLYLAD